MDETCEMLRTVWGTTNARTLPLSATGSAGMEAAFVNTVHPGDVVVVAVNGLFGQRMCDVAARCGAEVVAGRARVGHAGRRRSGCSRPTRARRSSPPCTPRPRPASAPTSPPSAPARATRCCVTDAVTSIGGIELRADDWGIDVGYAGTQKCLGVAPGLAPFTINDRAFERRVEKPQSWYLDLGLLGGYVGEAVRLGRPDLPPHRADRDGREPARRPDPDPRRGPRRGLGAARRGRRAAPGRAGGDGPRAVRGRRATGCPS